MNERRVSMQIRLTYHVPVPEGLSDEEALIYAENNWQEKGTLITEEVDDSEVME